MKTFKPKLEILPPQQLKLWPELSVVPDYFVLYGGTGLALQIGHRESVDFDFFTSAKFVKDDLFEVMPWLEKGEPAVDKNNNFIVWIEVKGFPEKPVKLSFFGNIRMGRVGNFKKTDDNAIKVAGVYH